MTNTVLEKKGSIHPSAVIHPSAEIGEGVIIGPNVVIGEGVKLGNGTRVIANAYIEFAEIGENCTISPFHVTPSMNRCRDSTEKRNCPNRRTKRKPYRQQTTRT